MRYHVPVRRLAAPARALLATLAAVSLAACSLELGSSSESADDTAAASSAGEESASPSPTPSAGATSTSGGAGNTAPGYAVGEIPPVPMFTLPDLSLLTESPDVFTPDLTRDITSVPGVSVGPARCDEPGVLSSGAGSTVLSGGGSASTTSEGSSVTNDGAGAGAYSDPQVTITNNGDGSGTFSSAEVSIVANGDGSGTYSDSSLSVTVSADGSGTYSDSRTGESVTITANGSGTYSDEKISITNNGDGSGTYSDEKISIVNGGDGTALVSSPGESVTVEADPLPKVGKVGPFPSIDALQPVASCGTLITLEDGVLFDFGSSQIRDDASQTLGNLAAVLVESGAPSLQVHGHTDSVSDDAFNQTLSEERAHAVVTELARQGVTASIEAAGYGESRPVAPNENEDGSDNPAGRQLNRRVEVFVPAF